MGGGGELQSTPFLFSPCLGLVRPLHHLHPSFCLLHELLVFLPSVSLQDCLELLRHSQELQIDVVGLAVLDLGSKHTRGYQVLGYTVATKRALQGAAAQLSPRWARVILTASTLSVMAVAHSRTNV